MKKKLSEKDRILKDFINEFFAVKELFKVGFFKKEMKGDYNAMAERICSYFGYKSVFEYGKEEIRCHITYSSGSYGIGSDRPLHVDDKGELKEDPFITIIPKIWGD